MTMQRRHFTTAALGLTLATALTPLAATAQTDWPPQKLTFVVALGPGGSADRTARAISSAGGYRRDARIHHQIRHQEPQ